ncbi:MAG TPA: ankyrin repeat domain-containing protein [Verrucomicrobiae bacterium]
MWWLILRVRGSAMNNDEQLVVAINAGDAGQVKELIAQGANVNAKHEDKEGYSNRTPLMHAAMGGHLEIVKQLLAAGADHKAKDRFIMPSEGGGETPLHHAIRGKHHEVVRALIAAGAKVNSKSGGDTALRVAVGKGDAKLVQTLLESGANPNGHKDGFTAMGGAVMNNRVEIARLLLGMGADPDYQDPNFQESYLMEAAAHGKIGIVKALLEAKANVHLRDDTGCTALMKATEGGKLEQIDIKDMAQYQDDPRLVGSSTLRTNKHADEIVELILKAGADVNARTPSGWSPLMFAMAAPPDRTAVINILRKAGSDEVNLDWLPVIEALEEKKPWKEVEPMYLKVKNPNVRMYQGGMILSMISNEEEEARAIRVMVEHGADPNLGAEESNDGDCFLSKAVYLEDEELVRWLIRKGANPNLNDRRGKNILAESYKLEKMLPVIQEEMKEVFRGAPAKEPAPPDFSEAATAPKFQEHVARLAKKLKAEPKPVFDDRAGGVSLAASKEAIDELLIKEQFTLRCKGVYLLALDHDRTRLGLLPTNSWAKAVAFMQTSAPNDSLTNSAIIRRLQEIELEFPFVITGAGADFIAGRFTEALKNSKKVAQLFYDLCPDFVDQGAGTVANAATQLKKAKQFFLWWD